MPRRPRIPAGLLLACACAATLAGCGAVNIPTVPDFPTMASPQGDAATFDFGRGGTTRIVQSGSATVHISDGSKLNHDGPLGCRGRYFLGDYTEHIRFFFRYTRRNAWLLVGTEGREFALGRSRKRGGSLVWSGRAGGRPVRVTVECPLPRRSRGHDA